MNTYPSETGSGEKPSFDPRGLSSKKGETTDKKEITGREHAAAAGHFPGKPPLSGALYQTARGFVETDSARCVRLYAAREKGLVSFIDFSLYD